jgi:hypothetical protein
MVSQQLVRSTQQQQQQPEKTQDLVSVPQHRLKRVVSWNNGLARVYYTKYKENEVASPQDLPDYLDGMDGMTVHDYCWAEGRIMRKWSPKPAGIAFLTRFGVVLFISFVVPLFIYLVFFVLQRLQLR